MTPDERLDAIEADLPHVHRPDGVWLVEQLRDARAEAQSHWNDARTYQELYEQRVDTLVKVEAELAAARAEVERQREEVGDQHTLIQRQGDLLTDAVNALRGEPPELTWWSHHDVAERAAGLVAELAAERAKMERVEKLPYASDDGSEYEHNDGCEGEPTCPACWARDIRAALTGGDR